MDSNTDRERDMNMDPVRQPCHPRTVLLNRLPLLLPSHEGLFHLITGLVTLTVLPNLFPRLLSWTDAAAVIVVATAAVAFPL